MTNGQPETWARWGNQGPELREVFRLIDPALMAFAETNQMDVSRWRWDAPDRTLTWTFGQLQRSLHVYRPPFEETQGSYDFIIEGSAWQDRWVNGTGERSWRSQHLDSIWHNRPLTELDDSLGESIVNALVKGFQVVQSWELSDLNETHHLLR